MKRRSKANKRQELKIVQSEYQVPDAHDTLSGVASRELIPEYDLYQTNSFQALDQTYPVSILKSNK